MALDIFDCNSRVFEPPAIWEQYLAPEYRVPARSSFWYNLDKSGTETVIVNGTVARPLNRSRIIRQAIWRPSMTPDQVGSLDPREFHALNPGASDPIARLNDMDAMGIHSSLLFPTVFAEYFPTVENPDVARALAVAYNDWILEFATADPNRLIPAAILPLQEATFSIEEARRITSLGFRAVSIRPAFFHGRFLNHPYYRPLWAELETLGLTAFISAASGSSNPEWTSGGAFVERVASNLQIGHDIAESVAPTMDNALALTGFGFYGHMEDYPTLKLAFVHGGASWIPLALEKLATRLALSAGIRDVSLDPEHVFLERPSLVVFDTWESSIPRLLDFFGEIAAWGSRYPNHDASMPKEAVDMLRGHNIPDDSIERLMGGNVARFLGIT